MSTQFNFLQHTHFDLHIFFTISVEKNKYVKSKSIKSKDVRNIVLKGTWVSLRHLDFHFSKYISNLKLGGLRYFEGYFLLRYERRYFSLWQICLLGQVGCQVTQKIRYQSNIDWGETPEKQGDRRTGPKGKWEHWTQSDCWFQTFSN